MKQEIAFPGLEVQLEQTRAAHFLKNHRIIGRCYDGSTESLRYKAGEIFAQMSYSEVQIVGIRGKLFDLCRRAE